MSGRLSLIDSARQKLAPKGRKAARQAYADRKTLRFTSLAVDTLEERLMLTLLGQQLFPSDYPWNQNIANAPVAANSAAIIAHIGSSVPVHPDWGEDSPANGDSPLYGIPYNVVHGNTTAKINVIIDNYPGESDIVPVPIPAGAVIEGDYQNGPNPNGGGYNSGQRGDSHLLIWDEDTDTAYELYGVTRPSDPTLFPNTSGVELPHTDGLWHAAQETVWHMSEEDFRALGDTSADAAGLSILAGLARPDEGLPTSDGGQGAIDHALRFTLPAADVAPQYIYPASHVVSESSGSTRLPLGSRLRLANTPAIDQTISQMQPEAQIIARAMQQYGLVLADIGSAMYVTGTSASQDANNDISLTWNMNDVLGLRGLTAGDFQVVNLTPVVTGLSASSDSAGSTITVNGQNFSGAAGHLQVFFGTVPATTVTYISDSQISAVVPSGTGTVNVTVQSGVNETDPNNPQDNVNAPIFGYGISAVSTADQFTFGSQTVSGANSSAAFAKPIVTVGTTDTLTITVDDGSGNPISGLASSAFGFSLAGGTSTGTFGAVSETATKGTYTTTFSGTAAGTAGTVTITVNGVSLATKPSIQVVAPITITGVYVKGTAWSQSGFLNNLPEYETGASTSLGFALQTGANQAVTLPWTNINVIEVVFGAPPTGIATNSLDLLGGSGGTVPSVTGMTHSGNVYTWSLSGPLTNNHDLIAIASTGSAFGTPVTDAQGAGLSGTWNNGSSTFPSGGSNPLAGGAFYYYFNVLPGDVNRDSVANSLDITAVSALANGTAATKPGYEPYDDLNGDGIINSLDLTAVRTNQTGALKGTAPATPADAQTGAAIAANDSAAGVNFVSLELGAQEATATAPGSTTSPINVAAAAATSAAVPSATATGTPGAGSGSTTVRASGSTTGGQHGRHRFAATDEVVSRFEPADLGFGSE